MWPFASQGSDKAKGRQGVRKLSMTVQRGLGVRMMGHTGRRVSEESDSYQSEK